MTAPTATEQKSLFEAEASGHLENARASARALAIHLDAAGNALRAGALPQRDLEKVAEILRLGSNRLDALAHRLATRGLEDSTWGGP